MIKKVRKKVPELRFPEFHGDWQTDRIDHFLTRYVKPVDVQLETEYEQIGIRSHGKGIFHKDPVTGEELGNKRVYWVHPEAFTVNIVFAWEQAVALTSSDEQGFIASHRFLMFLPKENRADLKFVLLFFLRRRGKHLLELASPGGAGRNKTLGQDSFAELKITLPQKEEQEKIASFLGSIDKRLTELRRKHELLQTYKRGVMQKIFSQEVRFKGAIGSLFPDWRKKKLSDIANIVGGGTPDTYQEEYWVGQIQWFTPTELKTKYVSKSARTITSLGLEKSSAKVLPKGTLLFSSRATVGDVSITLNECATNQGFQSFIVNTEIINEFLYYWIIQNKKAFLRRASGSTFLEISKQEIQKIPIYLPFITTVRTILNR